VEETRARPDTYGHRARELRPVVAQISGGEPLLRNDLEEIVAAVSNPGGAPYVVLTTNAVALTEGRLLALRQAGVDEFSVSLDYPDARHDDFRRIPGLFERIRSLILSLADRERESVTLACVVQRHNFRDLLSLAELAEAWGVRLNFSTYTPLRTEDEGYMPSADEIAELENVIGGLLAFRKDHGIIHTSEHVFSGMLEFFKNGRVGSCGAGARFLVVNPEGTLSPCGLVIRDYETRNQLLQAFSTRNTCGECYTSIRANSEKPVSSLVCDGLRAL
jgi:MoaA/NifB/PqqE/SkfB family radical SAM enzyme